MVASIMKCVSSAVKVFGKSSPSTGVGYSRLKSVFTRGLNYENYGQIVGTAKNKIIGNIPDELRRLIITNHPEKKGELIKRVQSGFAEASEHLNSIENAKIESLKKLSIKQDKAIVLESLASGRPILDTIPEEILMRQNAAESIRKSLIGIIPDGAKVDIQSLGEGSFGKGYRISFTDANGKKIFQDRVMKVFKNSDQKADLVELRLKKTQEFLDNVDEETYRKLLITQNVPNADKLISAEIQKAIQQEKEHMAAVLKDVSKSKLIGIESGFQKIHGINAEANSALYVKKSLGHSMSHSDLVKPDMFDLEHKFSLAPFADESLPKITSKTDFKKLGLDARDLHDGNVINGRVIDFGAIMPQAQALLDKTTLKYYKKIMNHKNGEERLMLIKRLEAAARNPKTPDRNKIQAALDIVKEYPQENQPVYIKGPKFKFNDIFNIRRPDNLVVKRHFALDPKRNEEALLKYKQQFEKRDLEQLNRYKQPVLKKIGLSNFDELEARFKPKGIKDIIGKLPPKEKLLQVEKNMHNLNFKKLNKKLLFEGNIIKINGPRDLFKTDLELAGFQKFDKFATDIDWRKVN